MDQTALGIRSAKSSQIALPGFGWFAAGEFALLAMMAALAAVVKSSPGPLPGDVSSVLAVQHALLPHHTIATLVEFVSEANWPVPSAATVAFVIVGLLLVRHWLDAIVSLALAVLSDLSSYLTNQVVQRPRPQGHGIVMYQQITAYFSFPSGHVVHAVAFFGFLLFLTFQTQRWPLVRWLARIVLVAFIVLMAPSRLLEGEHWLTDVLEGALYGAFWLALSIYIYVLAARRWPRLLGHDQWGGTTESAIPGSK